MSKRSECAAIGTIIDHQYTLLRDATPKIGPLRELPDYRELDTPLVPEDLFSNFFVRFLNKRSEDPLTLFVGKGRHLTRFTLRSSPKLSGAVDTRWSQSFLAGNEAPGEYPEIGVGLKIYRADPQLIYPSDVEAGLAEPKLTVARPVQLGSILWTAAVDGKHPIVRLRTANGSEMTAFEERAHVADIACQPRFARFVVEAFRQGLEATAAVPQAEASALSITV